MIRLFSLGVLMLAFNDYLNQLNCRSTPSGVAKPIMIWQSTGFAQFEY